MMAVESIQEWLEEFRSAWVSGDVERVLSLFADDVVYFENPEDRLESQAELREVWENVKRQEDIELDLEVVLSEGDRYIVEWSLDYMEKEVCISHEGFYLVFLEDNGVCSEFWQIIKS